MIGRAYTWRGDVWLVLARWGSGPRNVLLVNRRREYVVRPFRGLRRVPQWIIATSSCWHLSRRCAEAAGRRSSWAAFPLQEAHDPGFYEPCGRCAQLPKKDERRLSPPSSLRDKVARVNDLLGVDSTP